MSKRQAFHERLDKILDVFFAKDSEVTMAQSTLEDGTVIEYENTEVGTPVMVIVEGQDPTPVPDGEYKISETQILVCVEGKIAEVKEMEPEEEPEPEEMAVETPAEPAIEDIFNLEKLKSLIDLTKDGFHTISLSVANGKIEWGNIYSESFTELKEQLKLKSEELTKANQKFEEDLKILGQTIKETKVVQAPVEEHNSTPKTKTDIILSRLEENRKEKRDFYSKIKN